MLQDVIAHYSYYLSEPVSIYLRYCFVYQNDLALAIGCLLSRFNSLSTITIFIRSAYVTDSELQSHTCRDSNN